MSEQVGTPRVTRKAANAPVNAPRSEFNSNDVPVGQMPPIIMSADGPIVREPEAIEPIETGITDDYAGDLAFMEEKIDILVHPSAEKFAPKYLDVYVNGRPEWIPVGVPYRVARKYVEVMGRTKPTDIQTAHEDPTVERPNNQILRATRVKNPFSVVGDPNPRGREWLTRLLAEQ
jgi:hypothetical protein